MTVMKAVISQKARREPAYVLNRVLERVKRSETGCWEWQGAVSKNGYGNMYCWGRWDMPHRVVYKLTCDEVEGMVVCHKCDNKKCCNPVHLFAGTQQDNVDDMWKKGRAKPLRGSQTANSILTEDAIVTMKAMYLRGEPRAKIAAMFGVHSSTVTHAVRGACWKHVGEPVPSRLVRKLNVKQIEYAVKQRSMGWSYGKIGKDLGVAAMTVIRSIERHKRESQSS